MKIVFEHEGRKTTVLGDDYNSIFNKIRSIFPDQNHRPIQFYDPELTDYFEFTSYEQITDQPNGLKMNFDMSNKSDLPLADSPSPPMMNKNENDQTKHVTKVSSKRSRKRHSTEHDDETNEIPILPTYCDVIVHGLQSRESFPAIQKEFLRQTSAHLIQQYGNRTSRNFHSSFVLALTEKYPMLNYLNKNVDGINGKAKHHTISQLLSRKKRNTKYLMSRPKLKRLQQSTLHSNSNNEINEDISVDMATEKGTHDQMIERNEINSSNECSILDLLNESNMNETLASPPDAAEQLILMSSLPKTPVQPSVTSTNDRRATISLVPSSTSSVTNDPSISVKPVIIKAIATTNVPPTLIYHNGRMYPASVATQSIVAVHKAIKPRDKENKQTRDENNNSTSSPSIITQERENILKSTTIDNIEQSNSPKENLETWFPKLSKSAQNAYNKDVSRLRSILKPKKKSTNQISIGEIHALIRNSHKIRRRTLHGKENIDFISKVLEYQEIFHEEALILDYSLLKDEVCKFEEVQTRARDLLDSLIEKYSIGTQEQMSEADFLSMKMFCEDVGEHDLFFKNGITGSHPIIGIVIMSSTMKEFEKTYMFVRNLPYKMSMSITGGGLHKILALLLTVYVNLNDTPTHKLIRMLFDQCYMKKL